MATPALATRLQKKSMGDKDARKDTKPRLNSGAWIAGFKTSDYSGGLATVQASEELLKLVESM